VIEGSFDSSSPPSPLFSSSARACLSGSLFIDPHPSGGLLQQQTTEPPFSLFSPREAFPPAQLQSPFPLQNTVHLLFNSFFFRHFLVRGAPGRRAKSRRNSSSIPFDSSSLKRPPLFDLAAMPASIQTDPFHLDELFFNSFFFTLLRSGKGRARGSPSEQMDLVRLSS